MALNPQPGVVPPPQPLVVPALWKVEKMHTEDPERGKFHREDWMQHQPAGHYYCSYDWDLRTEDGLVVLDEQEAWFKLVRANARVLKVAPDNVRENVPVVNEAVTYNGDALGYVPESFIEYSPTVMLAVRNRWSALQFAGSNAEVHRVETLRTSDHVSALHV